MVCECSIHRMGKLDSSSMKKALYMPKISLTKNVPESEKQNDISKKVAGLGPGHEGHLHLH